MPFEYFKDIIDLKIIIHETILKKAVYQILNDKNKIFMTDIPIKRLRGCKDLSHPGNILKKYALRQVHEVLKQNRLI